jgi:hypothetical protein
MLFPEERDVLEAPEGELVQERGNRRMFGQLAVEPTVMLLDAAHLFAQLLGVLLHGGLAQLLDGFPGLTVEPRAELFMERVERLVNPALVLAGRRYL